MPEYCKKPVIEAVQFDGTPAGANAVFDEFDIPGATFVPGESLEVGEILIPALKCPLLASAGDWILKGVQGEFYLCKPVGNKG